MFRRRAREETAVHAATVASSSDGIGAGVGAGIYLRTVKPGDAANYPQPGDAVNIHYEAFLKDTGEKFDSTRDRRRPISFRVGEQQVIEGLEVAMLRMSRGQVAEVTIPHELGYGAQGYPPIIPSRSDLIFVVELIAITSS